MSKFHLTLASAGRCGALALAAWIAGATLPALADTLITSTVAAQVDLNDPGTYPTSIQLGTFSLNAPGGAPGTIDTLVGATISGFYGSDNFFNPTTAPGIFTVGGVTVATCNDGDPCTVSDSETAWSYTFTASDLTTLFGNGISLNEPLSAIFSVSQTDFGNINIDATTLSLDFQVPEPATAAVFGAGLLGLAIALRSKRA